MTMLTLGLNAYGGADTRVKRLKLTAQVKEIEQAAREVWNSDDARASLYDWRHDAFREQLVAQGWMPSDRYAPLLLKCLDLPGVHPCVGAALLTPAGAELS